MSGLGYFAFPPPASALSNEPSRASKRPPQVKEPHSDHAANAQHREAAARARTEQRKAQNEARQRRLQAERELALQSEMDHVRAGQSIRDRHGRIDTTRTEYVRAEMRRRDAQARRRKQWDTYQARWRALLASDTPITFADVPWPVANSPSSVRDLEAEAVVQFFLDSLQVEGRTAPETDRLRSALLRWHPDKMAGVLARAMDEDLDDVREGINIVFRALHARLHHVKDSAAPKQS